MQCFRCKSLMTETGTQAAGHSQVTWYQCPTCGMEQLHAQRQPAMALDPGPAAAARLRRVYGGQ